MLNADDWGRVKGGDHHLIWSGRRDGESGEEEGDPLRGREIRIQFYFQGSYIGSEKSKACEKRCTRSLGSLEIKYSLDAWTIHISRSKPKRRDGRGEA